MFRREGTQELRWLAGIAAILMLVLAIGTTPAAAAPGALKVLIVYVDPDPDAGEPTKIKAEIAVLSGVSAVDTFNGNTGTPTLAQLTPYDVVLMASNNGWSNSTEIGDVLADYIDQGGVVTAFSYSWSGLATIGGRWLSGGYSPYSTTGGDEIYTNATLGTHDASHPLLQGVTALASDRRSFKGLAAGATQIAQWSDSTSAVAVKGRVVGVTSYIGNAAVATWSGNFAKLVVNAGNVLGPHALTVARAGTGNGTVTSSPAGIDCGSTCSSAFAHGTAVTLTPSAAGGSTFAGWSGGGCAGTGTCTVSMNEAMTVTATFDLAPTLVAASPPASTSPSPPGGALASNPPGIPSLAGLTQTNRVFAVARASTALTGSTVQASLKRGTTFSFRLDRAATITVSIQRKTGGRRVARTCARYRATLRLRPRCTRLVPVTRLSRTARAGLNKLPFTGRIRGRALPPGAYRATFVARTLAGASQARTIDFVVVPA